MHDELHELHLQVFGGPFGKPKDIPHLLERMHSIHAEYIWAARNTITSRQRAVLRLMSLLATLVVARAHEVEALDLDFWSGRGRDSWTNSRWDLKSFRDWWPAIRKTAEQKLSVLVLPTEEGFLPVPPIPLQSVG